MDPKRQLKLVFLSPLQNEVILRASRPECRELLVVYDQA
ncbi:hypothetical protein PORCAN_1696 [Porphyromonas crevioricanis JCM 13913]|nr:hypothetical protein PORCAN_1696 [Porphyromonas crevioricanis JCM 13913]